MRFLKLLSLNLSILLFFLFSSTIAFSQPYTLVVHNVENLFDLDGYAVYDDYRSTDRQGNPQYTPAHVLTKLEKTSRLMARYNEGAGPDIIMFVEIESDYSQYPKGERPSAIEFLDMYKNTTTREMILNDLDDVISDIPSEYLLLKAMSDHGLIGYDVAVAYDLDTNRRPNHVQKNVIFSRLTINHEKTRSHAVEDARPILEVWIDVNGHDLVLFNNHWKSRASDAEIEKTRVQNATVLKNRLDELRAENSNVDYILGGDFNSDYNQSYRYNYMEKTAVNDVLKSTGDERAVKNNKEDYVYNLWYEIPVDERGSDTFRGYWGTLMQIMIGSGLYDYNGIQYVDNSFDVGRFPGKNVYENSGAPRRWHFLENGGGYSDHLPLSMEFIVVDDNDTSSKITLENPGFTDDEYWSPISVFFSLPPKESLKVLTQDYQNNIQTVSYFDELYLIEAPITADYKVVINDQQFDLWSPGVPVRELLTDYAGSNRTITFVGRLNIFRGNWQFVIEDPEYVNPTW